MRRQGIYWICYTNPKGLKLRDCLGIVEFYRPGNCWKFDPKIYTSLNKEHLRDLAHFLGQLPKP